MVRLVRAHAHQHAGPPAGDLARDGADRVGVDARGLLDVLGPVLPQVLDDARVKRADGDVRSVGERDLRLAVELRRVVAEEVLAARLYDTALRVEVEELVVEAVRVEVAGAQEALGVVAYEQRHVRLRAHEVLGDEPLLDDHLAHRERHGGVASPLHRHVVVGVRVARADVGGEQDDLAAVVTGLRHVVVEGDGRVDRVRVPEDEDVGVEEIRLVLPQEELAEDEVVTGGEVVDRAVEVEDGATDLADEPVDRHPAGADLGRALPEHRLPALRLDRVDERVGDLVERLVPRDAFPLSAAALADTPERVEQAVGCVALRAPRGALVAPHREVVGRRPLDVEMTRQRPGDLLAHDLVVLHIHAVRAAARVAVHAVGAPGDTVELEPVAVPTLRIAQRVGSIVHVGHQIPPGAHRRRLFISLF